MRREDWPSILTEALAEAKDTPFSWGEFDCLYWTGKTIKRYTDRDPIAECCKELGLSPDERYYKSAKGMKKLIEKYSFDSFYDMACQMYGSPIKAVQAQRGDLVMIEVIGTVQRPTLGICRGIDAMFKTLDVTVLIPLAKCTCAWRIS